MKRKTELIITEILIVLFDCWWAYKIAYPYGVTAFWIFIIWSLIGFGGLGYFFGKKKLLYMLIFQVLHLVIGLLLLPWNDYLLAFSFLPVDLGIWIGTIITYRKKFQD